METVYVIAADLAEHERLAKYRKASEIDFSQIQACLNEAKVDSLKIVVRVLPQNFFLVGDIFRFVLSATKKSENGQSIPNPSVLPVGKCAQSYRATKEAIIDRARSSRLDLTFQEDESLQLLFGVFTRLGGLIDDGQLARYLGVLCDRVFIGPEVVHLDLANACTNACVFCGMHSHLIEKKPWRNDEWVRRRLPFEKIVEIADDLRDLRAGGHVAVCGEGDPSTHPRLIDILELLKQLGLGAALYSNCQVLTVDQMIRMVDLGLDFLIVNISAGTAKTYATIHQGKPERTYDDVIAKIRRVVERRKSSRRKTPEITLKHVLTRQNYRELPEMVEQCRLIGASHFYPELAHFTSSYIEKFLLDQRCLSELGGLLKTAKERCRQYGISVYDNLDLQLAGLEGVENKQRLPITYRLYERRGCYAGWFFTRIYTDRQVGFCCRSRKFADISNRRFSEVWQSSLYSDLRLKAKYFDRSSPHRCLNGQLLLSEDCDSCGNFYTNDLFFRFFEEYGLASLLPNGWRHC